MDSKTLYNNKISLIGCGWLGLSLARDLEKRGYKIQVSTTSTSKVEQLNSKGFIAIKLDIEEPIEHLQEFFNCGILIINITSKSLSAFKNLIEVIKRHKVEKVIFTSSTSVYPLINDWVDEKTPTNDSKLAQIENLFLNHLKPQTTILRLAGLYGYDRQPGRFFREKKAISNPKGFINLVHRDDVITTVNSVINKKSWGQIYNVCSDEHPQRKGFYTQQMQLLGRDIPEFEAAENSKWKKVSNHKIKNSLDVGFIKFT